LTEHQFHSQIDNFLQYVAAERGFSANTAGAYRNDVSQFAGFLEDNGRIEWDLDREILQQYHMFLLKRKYADTTVARKIAAVRSFLHFLQAEGVIHSDLAEHLTSPRIGKYLPHSIAEDDVEFLLAMPSTENPAGLRDRAMLRMLWATGMRVTELITLDLEHVDMTTDTVRCIGKGFQRTPYSLWAACSRGRRTVHRGRSTLPAAASARAGAVSQSSRRAPHAPGILADPEVVCPPGRHRRNQPTHPASQFCHSPPE